MIKESGIAGVATILQGKLVGDVLTEAGLVAQVKTPKPAAPSAHHPAQQTKQKSRPSLPSTEYQLTVLWALRITWSGDVMRLDHKVTCRVCGELFSTLHIGAATCSNNCRSQLRYGYDLAYVDSLPVAERKAERERQQARAKALDEFRAVVIAERKRRDRPRLKRRAPTSRDVSAYA